MPRFKPRENEILPLEGKDDKHVVDTFKLLLIEQHFSTFLSGSDQTKSRPLLTEYPVIP